MLQTHGKSLETYRFAGNTNGTSLIQGVRPLVEQRGAYFDGSWQAAAVWGLSAAVAAPGNAGGWNRNAFLSGGLNLHTGTYVITVTDLSLAADGGASWPVVRTYNARQQDKDSAYIVSGGPQGNNWFALVPEIVLHDDSGSSAEDVVYLLFGADRYFAYKRDTAANSDEFKGVNGTEGVFQFAAGSGSEPDTYTLTLPDGMVFVFFGFDTDSSPAKGQLWYKLDPDGNKAYAGHATTGSTAISSGFDGSGRVTKAYDASANDGRRFSYTYNGDGKLTQVKAETKTGGTWASPTGLAEVGKVDYTYYGSSESYGSKFDLKTVTVTTPMTDSGVNQVNKTYFRYWTGTFNASTNPGHPSGLQYVVAAEGYRQADWAGDSLFDDDPLTMTETNLKPYASAYFEYDSAHRIVETWLNGRCGCSGASNGTFTFSYDDNGGFSNTTDTYDTDWKTRTVVKDPPYNGGTAARYTTTYFDETGQALSVVHSDGDPAGSPTTENPTHLVRNGDGQITRIDSPASVTGYTHDSGGNPSGAFTVSTTVGLVNHTTRISSGDTKGLIQHRKHSTGTSGSAYFDATRSYTTRGMVVGDVTIQRVDVSTSRAYHTEGTTESSSNYDETSYSYTFHSGTNTSVLYVTLKQLTRTNPVVSTGNNGSGSATSTKRYLRKDGTIAFTESAGAIFSYIQLTDGLVTKQIRDVKLSGTFPSGDDPNTDWGITENSNGVDRTTTTAYDAQNRVKNVTLPGGRKTKTYYSILKDRRSVTVSFPREDIPGGDTTWYGPGRYTVTNQAGRVEAGATIDLASTTTATTGWIDETDADAKTALDIGSLHALSTSVYNETGGTLDESRVYFSLPSTLPGTEGTHYDASYLAYNDLGLTWRSKSADGTITRTVYDFMRRVVKSHIGTNDYSFDDGEGSGPDDMVKTGETVYDSAGSGNSYVTKRTAYVQDSDTNKRETTFTNDVRGRAVVVVSPTAPYRLSKFDNLGRVLAVGQYSSSSGLDAGDDPTTLATNRMALSETAYDEMGRGWKTTRHKIDQSDGSDDSSLDATTWRDADGRVIKTLGASIIKTFYDRLGRVTHTFSPAKINDTAYADADDVSGDHVLNERQTVYESNDSDVVWMTVSIDRDYDDTSTTGALDSKADGDDMLVTMANVTGRVQIGATWYDEIGRPTTTAFYGTNGGSNFDRDPATPLAAPTASSASVLVTKTTYNDDGTVQKTVNADGIETRITYDDAGRQTKLIANYVNGTPSGTNGDDDVHTRFVYTNGLRVKMWLDVDGDNVVDSDDQVTESIYGVTKGADADDSKIGHGSLLFRVKYPDSTGDTDSVTYAYNAQGQRIYMKDQNATVHEYDYDDSGRQTHDRVTTLGSGVDTTVKRITTAYDSLGRVSTATQFDNATVGSGSETDEVKYAYEDWGNMSKIEQDHNGAVGESGSIDDYECSYVYAPSSPVGGNRTVRLSSMTLPDGTSVSYVYKFKFGKLDDSIGRVSDVKVVTTVVASYEYLGVAAVAKTDLPEPDVFSTIDPAGDKTYTHLDRFNRVVKDVWTKDLATDRDFYSVTYTYGSSSGAWTDLIAAEDNVLQTTGGTHKFDWGYTYDALNRLTAADRGDWNGSSIPSTTAFDDRDWTLDQAGNFDIMKWNNNRSVDTDYTDAGEFNDDRTHNVANELTGRDTDDNGTDNYTLTFDGNGNTTDDGNAYDYVYDAWNRLVEINEDGTSNPVANYEYNALGWRTSAVHDTDDDDLLNDETTEHYVYDGFWRQVGMYEDAETSATITWCHHNAGLNGQGGSSKVDAVILRDRDTTGNGTLDERRYHTQNFRGDVVVTLKDDDTQVERLAYTPYGQVFGMAAGDTDFDGDNDTTDDDYLSGEGNPWNGWGDVDLDGDVDSGDATASPNNTLGRGVLSHSSNDNRRGYSGYVNDGFVGDVYHVRFRMYHVELGRWVQRDPLEAGSGPNLYSYAAPIRSIDPLGLRSIPVSFMAFIPGSIAHFWYLGTGWMLEPGNFGLFHAFATDSREFGERGTSKLKTIATQESTTIGSSVPLQRTFTGFSHRLNIWTLTIQTMRATPTVTANASSTRWQACSSWVTIRASAAYPFIPLSTPIDYHILITWKVLVPDVVTVTIAGWHDQFPYYEAFIDRASVYQYDSPWPGPAIALMLTTNFSTGYSVSAPTPPECFDPDPPDPNERCLTCCGPPPCCGHCGGIG